MPNPTEGEVYQLNSYGSVVIMSTYQVDGLIIKIFTFLFGPEGKNSQLYPSVTFRTLDTKNPYKLRMFDFKRRIIKTNLLTTK